MNNISVQILNPEAIEAASKMMVCAARLTQSGHKIKDLEDFNTIYNQSVSEKTRTNMINLPHPTIQKCLTELATRIQPLRFYKTQGILSSYRL